MEKIRGLGGKNVRFLMSLGLFAKEHRDKLHEAVYLFGWCCGRQTRRNGLVLGGKGLSYADIAEDMGESPATIRGWMRVCAQLQYIEVKHTLYKRLVIRVLNQKKYRSKQLDLPISNRHPEADKTKTYRRPDTDITGVPTPILRSPDADSRMNLSMRGDTDRPELEKAMPEGIAGLVPLPLWFDFIEMRRRKGKPLTPGVVDILTRKLLELQAAGNDPTLVIEQSVVHSWPDVYPLKKENQDGQRESFQKQRSRESAAAIDKVLGRFEKACGDIHGALPPARK